MLTRKLDERTRILAFCLPGIGDTLFAVPALRAIKAAWPGSHITALTMFRGAAAVLRQFSFIDEVVNHDFMHSGVFSSLKFTLGLRRGNYGVAFLPYPSNRLEYNALALLAGCRYRIGHRYQHMNRACGNWMKNIAVPEEDGFSNIEENLRLAQALTGERDADVSVQFSLSPLHIAHVDKWLAGVGLDDHMLIGLHPGGSTAKNHLHKRWPPVHFIELGRRLIDATGAAILVLGGPDEKELAEYVSRKIGRGAVALCLSDILHTCAVIRRCMHFISNDTALLHLARAVGVPATGIFGPTSVGRAQMHHVDCDDISLGLPCQPCFYYSPRHLRCKYGDYRCLVLLRADMVVEHVLARLDSSIGACAST
jgi:heptosyltransferase-2